MTMPMGDEFSRVPTDPSPKEQETCPDCGEPLPEDFQDGDVCCNCGYTEGETHDKEK